MVLPEQVRIPSLAVPLRWLGRPQAWESSEDSLRISAGPRCDLYVDPGGSMSAGLDSPPMLVCEPSGDFALSARVRVDFASTYDAGVLVVFRDELCWAKLCFERSPQGHAADAEVFREGALGRQTGPRRSPSALDLVGERLLNTLVAELEIVEGPVRGRRHVGHHRPISHQVRPRSDRGLTWPRSGS